jgi:hypothetical protein
MANMPDDMPPPNRSASEIAFVLRNAKWRRGHEVLRDLARAEGDAASATPHATRETKPRREAARKR